jgi:hypothetical protein
LGANGAPDTLLATKTQNIDIPWRPAGDPSCPDTGYGAGFAWKAANGICYNGLAFNAVFDLSSLNVFLPDDIIVGVAYNTQSYGAAPIGVNGPYNSLNVLVPPSQPVAVGSDDSVDRVFWNTATAGYYADSGASGVGIFRQDWNWTPYGTVAFGVSVSAPASYSGSVACSQGKEPNLVATYPVNGNDVDGVSFSVTSGTEYLFKASNTFTASSDTAYQADAGYTTHDGWTSLLSQYGIHGTGQDVGAHALLADLGSGVGILDWGSYNASHEYSVAYTPTSSAVQFVIGDRWGWWFNTPYQNQAGMTDNQGALSLAVYECKAPTPPAPTSPTDKNQCKNGGWKSLVDDLGHSFKNQGDCVSYVATRGKNKGAGN